MGANLILSMGALVIFGTFLSSSNRLMIGNSQIAEQNEYYITALSIAQSVIDEAKAKAFDTKTIGLFQPLTVRDSLTAAAKLGPETGEKITGTDTLSSTGYKSSTKFNDVDDYDNYKRLVNTQRVEGFQVSVKVQYADEISPDATSGSLQTFCKRMRVTVSSPYMPDNLQISYAFTY